MSLSRPIALTISGLDPSAGAGMLADIKTFENLKCYGLGVCSANTIQNEKQFTACFWTPKEHILKQLDTVLSNYSIEYIKIGIIEDWNYLLEIIQCIKAQNKAVKIILDPVIQSSTGFYFHENERIMIDILKHLYLITPNYKEIQQFFPDQSILESIQILQSQCNVLLKGGHRESQKGLDELFLTNGNVIQYTSQQLSKYEKHGSGCVFSSAITAYLALGNSLVVACQKAKLYIEQFLNSNPTLLGYHTL
ncbi:hydroxymethylpyrimidine kinase [Flavobacteriaceae bacterium UJ101]|nr:hydroxymethylpyrimidine kinase [Flavobacteriaceae bacterium UJ101]